MTSPFHHLNLDRQLACDFLGVFARCEFALKVGGFPLGDESGVVPNWDRFGKAIDAPLLAAQSPDLQAAIQFLLAHPPRKQVLAGGQLQWRDVPPDPDQCMAQQILLRVRRVRNNLFHGGKFVKPSSARSDRDAKLVQHALTVLLACVPLNTVVSDAYEN